MESVEITPETVLEADEVSVEKNHDVYGCLSIALARDANADALVTTDRDFEGLCEDEPFEYTNPVPDEVLSEFNTVLAWRTVIRLRRDRPGERSSSGPLFGAYSYPLTVPPRG